MSHLFVGIVTSKQSNSRRAEILTGKKPAIRPWTSPNRAALQRFAKCTLGRNVHLGYVPQGLFWPPRIHFTLGHLDDARRVENGCALGT